MPGSGFAQGSAVESLEQVKNSMHSHRQQGYHTGCHHRQSTQKVPVKDESVLSITMVDICTYGEAWMTDTRGTVVV